MGLYRRKPETIQAWKWHGDEKEAMEFETFLYSTMECEWDEEGLFCGLYIRTPLGRIEVQPGEWIIRWNNGNYSSCAHNIFAETYELV